jgi:hypothetical protein
MLNVVGKESPEVFNALDLWHTAPLKRTGLGDDLLESSCSLLSRRSGFPSCLREANVDQRRKELASGSTLGPDTLAAALNALSLICTFRDFLTFAISDLL